MNTWIQNADFTSNDIDHLVGFKEFEEFIDSFSTTELDSSMMKLDEQGKEFCPWGIGVNLNTDYGFHLFRDETPFLPHVFRPNSFFTDFHLKANS